MKTLTTLFLLLSVSLASAQATNDKITSNEVKKTNAVVINTKGVKKLEDIKIETINKTTYLELMFSVKENKNIETC